MFVGVEMDFIDSYIAALNGLIPAGKGCVLLDYPNHSNVGDSAIWLGEHYVLKRAGVRVEAIGDLFYDSWDDIASRIDNHIILIHGGGNFGDLWSKHQEFRERICKSFPANRVIQLPQSIYFGEMENRIRSREIFNAHSDFHLLVRDHASLEIAKEFAPGRSHLVPDAAMCLAHYSGTRSGHQYDMLLLLRTDGESSRVRGGGGFDIPDDLRVNSVDWLDEEFGLWHRYYKRLKQVDIEKRPLLRGMLNGLINGAAAGLARNRVQRGIDLIRNARVVVTDRLHTVILSWLCGIPVFFSDNTYGKLNSVVSCWLPNHSGIHRCETHAEAVAGAIKWLRG